MRTLVNKEFGMNSTEKHKVVSTVTYAQEYDHGVIAVDAAMLRPRMATAYIVKCGDKAVIIECGTQHSVRHILTTLERHNIAYEQVAHIMPTHVHLDHAGGAGGLMEVLPNAELLVHERGLRHLVDPSRLEKSSRQVYGDEAFEQLYGAVIPVPADRSRTVKDGEVIQVDGRSFEFMDTPGHAKHHYCVWDETSKGWFTGDTFGLSYRELDTDRGAFIFPTTTPIQFDPDAMETSIQRMLSKAPEWMYLTHFGRVGQVQALGERLIAGLRQIVDIAEAASDKENRAKALRHGLRTWLRDELKEHGWVGDSQQWKILLEPDLELNAQGIEFWLDHRSTQ